VVVIIILGLPSGSGLVDNPGRIAARKMCTLAHNWGRK
jgi:hypothetical protein